MKQAANHDMMRSANLLSVFNCIRRYGPITKKDIQQKTGLSWGSVSNITADLLEKHIISGRESTTTMLGRTPKGLDINLENNLIIGLDVNLLGLTGVVIDLKSRVKTTLHEPLAGISEKSIIPQAKAMIYRLMESVPDRDEVKGIAVSFPGHVDGQTGKSIKIQHFEGFSHLDIGGILEEEFGIGVTVEHDPNCIAVAEHLIGVAQDLDSFILVRLSRGIGMGIVTGGTIFAGYSGATGEIGHTVVNADGPRCQCGNHGCLESYSSVQAIMRASGEGMRLGLTPALNSLLESGKPMELETVAEAARRQDPYVLGIFHQAAAYAGVAIANVVNILDPQVVVLSGELVECEDIFLEKLQQTARRNVWRDSGVAFRVSHTHCQSAAVGAASLFIQKIFLGAITHS